MIWCISWFSHHDPRYGPCPGFGSMGVFYSHPHLLPVTGFSLSLQDLQLFCVFFQLVSITYCPVKSQWASVFVFYMLLLLTAFAEPDFKILTKPDCNSCVWLTALQYVLFPEDAHDRLCRLFNVELFYQLLHVKLFLLFIHWLSLVQF